MRDRNTLWEACGAGSLEGVHAWINKPASSKVGIDHQQLDWGGRTALHRAALDGWTEIVELLLDNGASVNMADLEGETPLYCAARGSHVATVKLLLSRRADPTIADNDGSNTLLCAAGRGSLPIVEALLDSGADPCLGMDGYSPLHASVADDHARVAECLMERGAAVMQRDATGNTPLHTAAATGSLECIELLLQRGAVLDWRDDEGKTALDWAKYEYEDDAVALLETTTQDPGVRTAFLASVAGDSSVTEGAAVQPGKEGHTVEEMALFGDAIAAATKNITSTIAAEGGDTGALAEAMAAMGMEPGEVGLGGGDAGDAGGGGAGGAAGRGGASSAGAATGAPGEETALDCAAAGGAVAGAGAVDFVPCESFGGARPGHEFKTGPGGTGYYRTPTSPTSIFTNVDALD
jgi:ankyrin repeat protein